MERKIARRIRRAKGRSKYHELSFLRYLKRFGWRVNDGEHKGVRYQPVSYAGRRIPVSGPMLGWCDGFATKQVNEDLHVIFFQIKPRSKTAHCYFEHKQLVSLYMLEELFEAPHVKVHKLLVGRLKRKWVIYEISEDDMEELEAKAGYLPRGKIPLFRLDRDNKPNFNLAL